MGEYLAAKYPSGFWYLYVLDERPMIILFAIVIFLIVARAVIGYKGRK
jgi:hypothetical protein